MPFLGVVPVRPSAAQAAAGWVYACKLLRFFSVTQCILQLKDDVRAIERRLREAQAAVAEQEEAMRAGEGEKRRAEQRRQEYTRQWSKDDDKLGALERSIQVCVAVASIAISTGFPECLFVNLPFSLPPSLYAGHRHGSDRFRRAVRVAQGCRAPRFVSARGSSTSLPFHEPACTFITVFLFRFCVLMMLQALHKQARKCPSTTLRGTSSDSLQSI